LIDKKLNDSKKEEHDKFVNLNNNMINL